MQRSTESEIHMASQFDDPWAAAQSASAPGNTATAPTGESQLAGSYGQEESQLFKSGGDQAGPSIINKMHGVGTRRTGIIIKPPYDRHSTNTKGELKFWQQGSQKPVTNAVNPITAQPNRAVMDTVLVLDTEYTMDATEAAAINREVPFEGGQRSFTAGGEKLKQLHKAIEKANERGVSITKGADMVGKRFIVEVTALKPNPNGGDPIKVLDIRIDNA
jgi:hypothetical protein